MTTTRDPLAVLRKHRDHHEAMAVSDAYSAQEAPRLREAIAQVEALVAEGLKSEDAMRWTVERLTKWHGLPAEELLARADAMRAVMEPFTPGQDSEIDRANALSRVGVE